MKKWIFAIMAIFIMVAFIGCPEPEEKKAEQVTITFDKNTTDSVTNLPAPMKIEKGKSLGTLPAGPTRANWEFDSWWLGTNGTNLTSQVSAATTFNANTTVYAKWRAPVDDTKWRITFNPNGGTVNPTYKDVIKGEQAGELPTPTFTGNDFDGWFTLQTGGDAFTATTSVNANITVFAHWIPAASLDEGEILALGNGGTALFAFTIPEGGAWEDYQSLSFKVKLVYPEQADQASPAYTNLYRARLFGPYDKDDMDGKTAFPSGGTFDGITYVTDTGMTLDKPANDADIKALAMRFVSNPGKDSFMHGWIAGTKASDAANYNAVLGTPENGWYTLNYSFADISLTDGNSPKNSAGNAGLQWPADDATGTFYFGLGLIGGNNMAIVQLVKDIQLNGYPGVDPIVSTGSGFDKPAYAANVVGDTGAMAKLSPKISDVWRSENKVGAVPPIYVAFSENFTGGANSIRWTTPGGTLSSVPAAAQTGFIFKGWSTDKNATSGAELTTSTTFADKVIYYATWEEDESYIPDPDWDDLDNKQVITWSITGSQTRQNAFLTYGATGANAPAHSPLSLLDVKNAVYLVLESTATDLKAGGSIGFASKTIGFPAVRRDIFNANASTHSSTQFIKADTGITVVINLKQAWLQADATALARETGWGQIAMQYYDGEVGWDQWTGFKATLLFLNEYVQHGPIPESGWTCNCSACKDNDDPISGGTCECTQAECVYGCEIGECGECSFGNLWKCDCVWCDKYVGYNECVCTEASHAASNPVGSRTVCNSTCACMVVCACTKAGGGDCALKGKSLADVATIEIFCDCEADGACTHAACFVCKEVGPEIKLRFAASPIGTLGDAAWTDATSYTNGQKYLYKGKYYWVASHTDAGAAANGVGDFATGAADAGLTAEILELGEASDYARIGFPFPAEVTAKFALYRTVTVTFEMIPVVGAPTVLLRDYTGGNNWTNPTASTTTSMTFSTTALLGANAMPANGFYVANNTATTTMLFRLISVTLGNMPAYVEPTIIADSSTVAQFGTNGTGTVTEYNVDGFIFVYNGASLNGTKPADLQTGGEFILTADNNRFVVNFPTAALTAEFTRFVLVYDLKMPTDSFVTECSDCGGGPCVNFGFRRNNSDVNYASGGDIPNPNYNNLVIGTGQMIDLAYGAKTSDSKGVVLTKNNHKGSTAAFMKVTRVVIY